MFYHRRDIFKVYKKDIRRRCYLLNKPIYHLTSGQILIPLTCNSGPMNKNEAMASVTEGTAGKFLEIILTSNKSSTLYYQGKQY